MNAPEVETDILLRNARAGDSAARCELLERYRQRLTNMAAVRMDPRLARRIDPSDVVQESLLIANRRLDQYLSEQPIAFYPWLRSLVWNRLIDLYRRHVTARCRTVEYEQPWELAMSNASAMLLADRLPGQDSTPSRQLIRREMNTKIKTLLSEMGTIDREIIVMRYLEGMSVREIADVLELPENTVKSRHFRALQAIRKAMSQE